MSEQLQIFTFGGLAIQIGGEAVTGLVSSKAEALLVYLACNRRAHAREILAEMLWEERSQSQSLANLRVVLASLRKHLGDYMLIERDRVALKPEASIWVDTIELEAGLEPWSAREGLVTAEIVEGVGRAIEIYRGEFLSGFYVREARGFEDWQIRERERLHQIVLDALLALVEYELKSGAYQTGTAYARRLLELDPLAEAAHRHLMQLLAAGGQRGAALEQYDKLSQLLAEELGLEPDAETQAVVAQIQAGKLAIPTGTVTFLFTEIEDNPKMLKKMGDRYIELLTEYHRILRGAFEGYGGREIENRGGSFFISFPRASEAIAAVIVIQHTLSGVEWQDGVAVSVRMGLHTGEPWLVEEGYVGMDVHRAARLAHAGHGGQVLLSETTTALVRDDLPERVRLLDLGAHRLEQIHRPERIHQLVIEGLPEDYPPLNSLEVVSIPSHLSEKKFTRLPRVVGLNPFKGLAAFQEGDAPFFFGREKFTTQLHELVQQRHLVAVIVGSSGSGKSSAVFAGLLPQLRGENDWIIVHLRPESQPFQSLARALVPVLDEKLGETERLVEAQRLARALRAGEVSLYQVVNRALEKQPGATRLLLVIDQFEELYTLSRDNETQMSFTDELLAAARDGAVHRISPITTLLTLRADFMGQALSHRPFADALQEGSLMLGPMTRDELSAAIGKPAELQGAAFEPGLVERILDDVGEEPGNLPLLEFALTLLWERMDQGWMTHEVYDGIGRVGGALARYADQVYEGLDQEEQEQARRAFVQLVQPGEGTEDTRRLARRDELAGVDWGLIQHLADERLVVTGKDEINTETVEVVHEALIRGWGQLREWMAVNRSFRSWQEGLRAALRGWEASQSDEGALLRGGPLAQAEDWLTKRGAEISQTEHAYIQESIIVRTRRQVERERRRRMTVGGLVIGLIVAILLSVFAFGQQGIAEKQARVAFSREVAAAATNNLDRDPELSILLVLEAMSHERTLEAENALHQAIQASPLRRTFVNLETNSASSGWITISPNGQNIFVSGSGGGALWSVATGKVMFAHPVGEREWINRAAFSPDGLYLVLPGESYDENWNPLPGSVTILDAHSGQEVLSFVAHDSLIQAVSFSPDGKLFATVSGDLTAKIWDLEAILVEGTGQPVHTLCCLASAFTFIQFSPDGSKLVTTTGDGFAKVWDVVSGEDLFTIGPDIISAAYSPDDRYLVTLSDEGLMQVWEATSGERLSTNMSHDRSYTYGVNFSPDGSLLASSKASGEIILWSFSPDGMQEILTLRGHKDQALGAVFSPDGRYLYSSSRDGTIKVWDISPNGSAEIANMTGIDGYKIFPNGEALVSSSPDGLLQLWDLNTWKDVMSLQAHRGGFAIDISSDGSLVATGGQDGLVKIWDADTWEMLHVWEAHEVQGQGFFTGAMDVAFSPDGSHLASGGVDGAFNVWDVDSWDRILNLLDHTGWVVNVQYSPDGELVASSSVTGDATVKIWDAHTGQLLQTLSPDDWMTDNTGIWGLDFSPDGSRLLFGRADHVVELWQLPTTPWEDTEKLNLINKFQSQAGIILSTNFHPDGDRIAIAGVNGVVEMREIIGGEVLLRLQFLNSQTRVDFTPDGSKLITLGNNLMGRVLALDTDELIALAKSRVTRSLTLEECRQYLHQEDCPAQ